jgi:hypothetical protein
LLNYILASFSILHVAAWIHSLSNACRNYVSSELLDRPLAVHAL